MNGDLFEADPRDPGSPEIELVGSEDTSLVDAAVATLRRLGVNHGHVAIQIVELARIHALNLEYRAMDSPTDVLSFPMDGEAIAYGQLPDPESGPFELGDVVICPEHTEDMVEAVVHGVLHLCGLDHETDDGEMLALQDGIVASLYDGSAGA
ncbi:MAG: rRNA maturation RNase YbeY [Actinobacteria bacterium]|nr:rRNA maturation RNase YbeY [Actinomycetota bacterium]